MKRELESTNFRMMVSGFEEWLDTLKKSRSTIKNYPLDVTKYFIYMESHHGIKHISKVEQHHAEQYKQYLQNRKSLPRKNLGISNQTINGAINAVNSFNKYIAQDDKIPKYNIYLERLSVTTEERIILSQDEIKELYNASFEPYPHSQSSVEFGQRDRVIIGLLYGAGLRLNELRGVDITDIDFQNKRVLVRNGKGGKQRFAPIPNLHLEDIRAYIQQGRYYFTERHHDIYCRTKTVRKKGYNPDEAALLLNIEGKRLTTFTRRLEHLQSKTQITKRITPHILRHSLGSHLYHNGISLDKIRIILGHSSIDTTQIYVHLSKQL